MIATTRIFPPLLQILLYFQFTSAIPSTTSGSCSAPPFTAPLSNCTFAPGVTSFGILVEVGGPPTPQRLCLTPSTLVNSTLVSVDSLCDSRMTQGECESVRGGLFDKKKSSTWKDVPLSQYNNTRQEGPWASLNPPGITDVGYDTLHIPGGNEVTLYGFGIALNVRGTASVTGMLGLGTESVFLDQVVAKNYAPSRSWSLDVGSQSAAQPRDGELVIGGYNKGRKDGNFVWHNVSDMSGDRPCPLRTTIKEMNIITEDGGEKPMLSSSKAVEVCIEPYNNLFRFTPNMLLAWKAATGYDGDFAKTFASTNAQNLTYTEQGLIYPNTMPKWSLSITLDGGYKTTIPQFELQQPLGDWNATGDNQVAGNFTSVAVSADPTKDGEVPTLGRIFLSQSLLTVDYTTQQFALAASKTSPGPKDLIPFPCEPHGPPPNNSVPTPPPPPSSSSNPAIIGGAAAVPCALAIIVLAFFLWRRYCRKSKGAGAGEGGLERGNSAGWSDSKILAMTDSMGREEEPVGSWGREEVIRVEFGAVEMHTLPKASPGLGEATPDARTPGGLDIPPIRPSRLFGRK